MEVQMTDTSEHEATLRTDRYQRMAVAEVECVADGIVRLRLELPDGGAVAPWEPGAHVELRLPSGLIRHYSLCGDPADEGGYEIAVLREPAGRGGSDEVHRDVTVGRSVDVSAPRNDFALEPANDYLFIAGGVGITPLLPMIERAAKAGTTWRLVYGGRTRRSMAFLDRVRSLGPDCVSVHIDDESGRPDLATELAGVREGARIYACGPGAMLDLVADLHGRDGSYGELHLERFAGQVSVDVTGDAFEVVAQRSGVSVTVGPDETILGALRPLVSQLPFSCEDGYCGTCETEVIEGVPDHRDTYLDEEERDSGDLMMICVSRCHGPRIVLDV